MIYAAPGEPFDFSTFGWASGLAGVLGWRIEQAGDVVVARSTDGVVESPDGSGVYQIAVDEAPAALGSYTLIVDDGDAIFTAMDLTVVGTLPAGPIIQPDLSPLALCTIEDVVDILGYEDDQVADRTQTIIRTINGACRAIARRAQRDFIVSPSEQTRYQRIASADERRRYIRVGDLKALPLDVSILTPDRDQEYEYDVDADFFVTPDTPDYGWPYETLNFKSSVAYQLRTNWWLKVHAVWGWPLVPEDIRQIAMQTSALWVANDVQKQTELARQQGRRVNLESLIPPAMLETVDEFRTYRVA